MLIHLTFKNHPKMYVKKKRLLLKCQYLLLRRNTSLVN